VTLFSEGFHRKYICDVFTICQEREEDFTLFPEVFLVCSSFRKAANTSREAAKFLAASPMRRKIKKNLWDQVKISLLQNVSPKKSVSIGSSFFAISCFENLSPVYSERQLSCNCGDENYVRYFVPTESVSRLTLEIIRQKDR